MAMSRSFGGTRLTTVPPMAISPSLISSRPAIMRSRVDLPQPDGPTRTQNSASAISKSTPRITGVEPKCLCTALIATAAKLPPSHSPRRDAYRSRWRQPSRASAALDDHVVGSPGREPADDIPCRLAPQLDLGLHAEESGVRRQYHLRMAEQRTFGGNRLDWQHVEPGSGKYSTIECGKQIVDDHDGAAGGIDEVRTGAHAREGSRIDHAAGLRGERDVRADRVALGKQAPEIGGALDVRRKIPVDEIGIEGEHAAKHVARQVRHAFADAAEPDDAQRHVCGAPQRSGRQVMPAAGADVAMVGNHVAQQRER